MKLLLVEDERKLLNALSRLLRQNGYQVDVAMDGNDGLTKAVSGDYDLLVLDRMLPFRDGISIVKEYRNQGFHNPVLFLTAKDTPGDRVVGLDSGADDYLVKPFSMEELLARLRALGRRKEKELVNSTISIAGLKLDRLKCEVTKDQELIKLSIKEASLLELLMSNYGQVVTKERIYEWVWGYNSQAEFANIDLYVHYLRKKLNTNNIKTVRGIGYFFTEDVHVS